MKFNSYDNVEQYLKGTLSKEDHQLFEEALQTDESLKASVEAHHWANELIIDNRLLDVKNHLQKLHQKTSKARKIKYTGIAVASLAIVSAALYVIFTPSSQEKNPVENTEIKPTLSKDERATIENDPLVVSTIEDKNIAKQTTKAVHDNIKEFTPVESLTRENPSIAEANAASATEAKIPQADQNNEHQSLAEICAKTTLHSKIQTKATCPGEQKGSITINDIEGGFAPYEVFISDKNGKMIEQAENLPAGQYTVDMVDANGCIQTVKNIIIPTKDCAISITFNPYVGEEVLFSEYFDKGYIKVFDQHSNVVFEGNLSEDNTISWNGYNHKGKIEEGFYVFSLVLPSGLTSTGEITLLK